MLNAGSFRNASTEEGDDKLWCQFNPTEGCDIHRVCGYRACHQVVTGAGSLILSGGCTQSARVRGALITDDGEAIEGAVAEEVKVMVRMTFFINSAIEDDRVV